MLDLPMQRLQRRCNLQSVLDCLLAAAADREMQDPHSVGPGGAMLTKDILFGMNIITLAGFVVMGLSLSLNRTGQIGAPLSVGLMCAGTALVFFGLYAGSEPR
jgi:hypothetical protein